VANGIRLTGMPAFKGVLTENEMWQVSLLLANADKPLPPAALLCCTAPRRPATAAPEKSSSAERLKLEGGGGFQPPHKVSRSTCT